MSETAKIRLVRCPKCENLLPEVTDYSVYQCGGCGAVLRAKNKGVDLDKSEEESVQNVSERYDKMVNAVVSDVSESDVRSSISSSSRKERRALHERGENGGVSLVSGRRDVESSGVCVRKSVDRPIREGFEDTVADKGNEDEAGRRRIRERVETGDLWMARRMDGEVVDHAEGGPSNVLSGASCGDECPGRDRDLDELDDVGCVERDRAELLKKLDELKDQLSRSGNLVEKGKEKVPYDRRMVHCDPHGYENWRPNASLEMSRVLVQQNPYPDAQFKGQPYHQNQYVEQPHLMRRQEVGGHCFYPVQYAAPSHVDSSRSQMHRRGPYRAPAPYPIMPARPYRSGPYLDDSVVYIDAMEPCPPKFNRHHPSCLCYECHVKRQVATPVFPTAYSDVPNDQVFSYQDDPGRPFGTRDYDRRLPNPRPPLRSHNAHSLHMRWPSDMESEVDGFANCRLPRAHFVSAGKPCRPIAGGVPFLTCYNCFELLLLPKRVLNKDNKRKKMRCGACSTLIVFTVSNKKLVILYDVEAKDDPTEVEDALLVQNDGRPMQSKTTFSSDDYDNTAYDFASIGRANRSAELNLCHSTSTYTSEVEEDWESLTGERKVNGSADPLTKNNGPSPPMGSSLQDHFEYSNKYNLTNRSREGNRSGRTDHEKANKTTSRQMSGKESSATEIDLSSNEFDNTGTTFDSGEANREEDRPKASRGAESFFAGIIKKSFKDKFNDTSDQEKATVTVNGHLIPNRLIKKAEKHAGPIHPGNYWYDFRAGFWGVIGGPCLGIIPPFIEEFNFPVLENCAGGNTRVFVNGRELNQKDLTLLGSRGLPTEPDRSYIIELSGSVLDEETSEELDCLGKLAPTVERLKRGFGMKAPKAAQ